MEFLQPLRATALSLLLTSTLGHAAEPPPPRLIVRGDDMGFAQSANRAMIHTHVDGIETSVEVLVPTPWFPEAARLLQDHPRLDVGIHLTLTSEWDGLKWRPVSHCPSLTDADGYFFPMVRPNANYPGRSVAEQNWKLEDIEQEFRAQIELGLRRLPRVSHVSGHMGCTSLTPAIEALTRRLAHEYGIDIDLAAHGVEPARYLGKTASAEEKLASFLAMLERLEPGKTYCFVDHPAFNTPEMRAIGHIGYEDVGVDRQGVVDTWTSPIVKAAIERLGIRLISYRDLVD